MAKHPMRRHRDDGRPTEPAVTFQFRNVEHYQEWMHGKGIQKVVQVIEGVSASAGEDRFFALRDALVEASSGAEFDSPGGDRSAVGCRGGAARLGNGRRV